MLTEHEIWINSYAQEKVNLEQLLNWFEDLSIEEKRDTILTAKSCLEQSHPTKEIIEQAIETIPLKSTVTPIIILKSNELKNALNRIVLLPENENRKSIITLITIFKIADTERRNVFCKGNCNHEWHNLERILN